MNLKANHQKQKLMQTGYVIVRDLVPPGELRRLRESADAIVDKAPASGGVTMTDWVDQQRAHVLVGGGTGRE